MRNLLLFLFLFLATTPALAGDRVIARVGNEPITQRELATALQQNPDLPRKMVLDLLIERQLVLVWAAGMNITVADEEVKGVETSIRERNNLTPDQFEEALTARGETVEYFRASIREQLIINKALGMALSPETKISESELRDLYEEAYPQETVVSVSHILLPVDPEATVEEDDSARRSAADVLERISGGAPFAEMASRYSQDPSSSGDGGFLGTFRKGELIPELEQLAATLEPGGVGGPVRTSAGYHILLLDSRGVSEPPPFVEVKSRLERQLMDRKQESARIRWLEELKDTTYIEVFPDGG